VLLSHERVDQQPPGGHDLLIGYLFGLARVPKKASGNEQQGHCPEEQVAFPLKAGLAQQTFEGPIGHFLMSHTFGRNSCPCHVTIF
jgi:hypothetical protein